MSNFRIPENEINVIALETKLAADYERSQQEQLFSRLSVEQIRGTFADGKLDGEIDAEPRRGDVEHGEINSPFPSPEQYQWISADYRQGYLVGVTCRLDELFAE